MEHSPTTRPANAHGRSAGELVKELSELVPRLIRDEMKLAQLEMTRKGKQAGVGAGMLGASGLVALYAIGCLLACAIIALSKVLAPWLSALIVGVVLLVVSAIVGRAGKSRMRIAAPPVPEEAVSSVQADVREMKERAHR